MRCSCAVVALHTVKLIPSASRQSANLFFSSVDLAIFSPISSPISSLFHLWICREFLRNRNRKNTFTIGDIKIDPKTVFDIECFPIQI